MTPRNFVQWDLGYSRQDPELFGKRWDRHLSRLLDLIKRVSIDDFEQDGKLSTSESRCPRLAGCDRKVRRLAPAAFRKELSLSPHFRTTRLSIAVSAFLSRRDVDHVGRPGRRLLDAEEFRPRDQTPRRQSRFTPREPPYGRGHELYKAGEFKKAIALFERSIIKYRCLPA